MNNMDFNIYQALAVRTKNENEDWEQRITNWLLGLNGESGELTDKIKKVIFHGHEYEKENIKKELGDILWYLTILADDFDIDLEEVAERNITKLKNRYPEGFSKKKSKERSEYKSNNDK